MRGREGARSCDGSLGEEVRPEGPVTIARSSLPYGNLRWRVPTKCHGGKLVGMFLSLWRRRESVELGCELGISLITFRIPQGEVVRNSDPSTDLACDWLLVICPEELRHLRYAHFEFCIKFDLDSYIYATADVVLAIEDFKCRSGFIKLPCGPECIVIGLGDFPLLSAR